MNVQKAEINEIYNFVYSTNWHLVNIFVKSVHCWNLGVAPNWPKSATWHVTGPAVLLLVYKLNLIYKILFVPRKFSTVERRRSL